MKRYLLDTNTVIAVLNDKDSRPSQRLRQCAPTEICLPSIVIHELFYGAFKSQRSERNLALVDALQFEVLDFDREDARQAGAIRAVLAGNGTPIGPYDVLIAGQAKARGMTLVTHNSQEFKRVPGLDVEDWEE